MKDKVALITGGARGIGRATALAFARQGAHIIIADRLPDEFKKVESEMFELGVKGMGITVDFSQRHSIQPFVDEVLSYFSVIHILVNNAAIGSGQNPKPIIEFDDDFWEASLFLNLTVPYLLMKAFLPSMIEHGWGRIINISSTAGKMGLEYGGAYCASKHGLIGLTRTAAIELDTTGVTVNAICPGFIRTPMLEKRLQFEADLHGNSFMEIEKTCNPIQRFLGPEEVAAVAVYLASEEAGGMTGQSLNISGGSIMH
jgi:NAD(P)-dependent dehydrogenase (short-subunit alcohol dehydrogenase family)